MSARHATLLAAVASLLLLAGCGGDDGDENGDPDGGDVRAKSGPAPRADLRLIGEFEQPLFLTQPPGSDDLYVVEKGGAVRIVREGEVLSTPFLDLSGEVSTGSEQGLLSIAFPPDYEETGLVYVNYTDLNGDTRVQEFQSEGSDQVDPDSRRELLFMDQPFDNHNGGLLLFGPDKMLYIGTGDGGAGGDPDRNGQDLSTLLGKILRIDPSASEGESATTDDVGGPPYIIPSDNPFFGRGDAREEVFAYGLRNPWRFSFDRQTGDLWIGDVGQDKIEEIDHVSAAEAAGANFGWSAYEGNERFNEDQEAPGHIPPVLTYELSEGNCSVTGGFVVRDELLPGLEGRYVYGDYCAGQLRSFELAGEEAADDAPIGEKVPMLSSFGEDRAGHVYVTSLEGPVYQLIPVMGQKQGSGG